MKRILIVEDDPIILDGLKVNLEAEQFNVECIQHGDKGLATALEKNFDLILLDVMLPGKSGFDICKNLRQKNMTCPIIILTARGQEVDKILGLEIGADDYVTKPFSIRELIARIHAHLRRQDQSMQPVNQFELNQVKVDFKKCETKKTNKIIPMTALEFKLLQYLIQKTNQVVSREELIKNVWEYETYITTRTVDNHILRLRKIFEKDPADPEHFITSHGMGYKFIP